MLRLFLFTLVLASCGETAHVTLAETPIPSDSAVAVGQSVDAVIHIGEVTPDAASGVDLGEVLGDTGTTDFGFGGDAGEVLSDIGSNNSGLEEDAALLGDLGLGDASVIADGSLLEADGAVLCGECRDFLYCAPDGSCVECLVDADCHGEVPQVSCVGYQCLVPCGDGVPCRFSVEFDGADGLDHWMVNENTPEVPCYESVQNEWGCVHERRRQTVASPDFGWYSIYVHRPSSDNPHANPLHGVTASIRLRGGLEVRRQDMALGDLWCVARIYPATLRIEDCLGQVVTPNHPGL